MEVGDKVTYEGSTGTVIGVRGSNATEGQNQVFVRWDFISGTGHPPRQKMGEWLDMTVVSGA